MKENFKLIDNQIEITKISKHFIEKSELLDEKQILEDQISSLKNKLVDINNKLKLFKEE